MTPEQVVQKSITRLRQLKLYAKMLDEECSTIIRELERVYAPAPKGGANKAKLDAAVSTLR